MAETHSSRGGTKSDNVEAVVAESFKGVEIIVLEEREVGGNLRRAGLPSRYLVESVYFAVWVSARETFSPKTPSAMPFPVSYWNLPPEMD